jgi:putative GTP pyrophosphokinase
MSELSRTKIDKLGERLKKDELTEEDLRLLNQFRQSFADSYQEVVGRITNELGLAPTGRLAKSTASISEKLKRESIRLTQMQDIAGCRIIVDAIEAQDQVVEAISKLFENVSLMDRRTKSSHGYRAVHLIVRSTPKVVEVQIRTALQHQWAELSEKLADKRGQSLKYGKGDTSTLKVLATASDLVKKHEILERSIIEVLAILTELSGKDNLSAKLQEEVRSCQERFTRHEKRNQLRREEILKVLQDLIVDPEGGT